MINFKPVNPIKLNPRHFSIYKPECIVFLSKLVRAHEFYLQFIIFPLQKIKEIP